MIPRARLAVWWIFTDNDSDDGVPALLIQSVHAAHGTTTIVGARFITPGEQLFSERDCFSYITDGAFTATALVTVRVIYQAADLWIPLNECAERACSRQAVVCCGMSGLRTTLLGNDGVHGMALFRWSGCSK
jgi:hypothetical protein